MKSVPIGARERAEINAQVEKVLRGLGDPEPPLQLDDVRELLRLDRQYYSSTDDSVLREFVSKVKIGAQQLLLRPTLLLDVVRKASLSALWVPDRQRILIDKELPLLKHRWAESHEVIHSITEWHKLFLFGDSAKELNPACHEQLEAEANYGAGQLLFLRDRFVLEARDMEMTLSTVKKLHTSFGNTITSTLWRYVEQMGADQPMAGLVTPHPHHLPENHDPVSPCKYFIESPAFRKRFGSITESEMFQALTGYCSRARGGPLGSDEVILKDVNGIPHVFWFETFFNRYEALTLAYHVRQHNLLITVPQMVVVSCQIVSERFSMSSSVVHK
jgi:hypothetical protein